MESQEDDKVPSRGRVLVRSHAMREEASPPREPSPLISPSIKVISSPPHTSPLLLVSPLPSRIPSPTGTFVLTSSSSSSPSCCHSQNLNTRDEQTEESTSPCHIGRGAKKKIVVDLIRQGEDEQDASQCNITNSNNVNNKKNIPLCDCAHPSTKETISDNNNHSNVIDNNNSSNKNNSGIGPNANTLTVTGGRTINPAKGKFRQQSSGSFEGSSSNSPCLSRDSSSEQYTDTSGIDLEIFIPDTLNRNPKDRAFMLRIEQELVSLFNDRVKTHYKFPPMSSYQRMLVHRCAAYFGMDHNIESSGKCVVVNKTKNTRIPEVEFKQHIKDSVMFTGNTGMGDEPRRSILKRDSNSIEEYGGFKSPDRQFSMENRRSKSFEEREEEYEKVRRRIFNREMSSNDEFEWLAIPTWPSIDSSTETNSRFKLQLPDFGRRQTGKLIKVLSEETEETLRPYVAKSYSFGGYGGNLNRGDSVTSTHSAGARLLTKQDSGASSVSWRLSPSSSGYKSQSQMSESVTPSPTSTPHPLITSQDSSIHSRELEIEESGTEDSRIVWAVTDIQSVPKGSIIIDPQNGQPIKNDDGSLYHYDPSNPPSFLVACKPPASPVKTTTKSTSGESPKKRRHYSGDSKTSVTNSSTSPSLPFSPPALLSKPSFQQHQQVFMPGNKNYKATFNSVDKGGGVETIPQQFAPPPIYCHEQFPLYQQQPCIVYAPYGMAPQYEGGGGNAAGDMAATFYSGPDHLSPALATYQQSQSHYWNPQQSFGFYQNQTTPPPPPPPTAPQRFQGFVPANYLPPPPPSQAPPPPPQGNEIVFAHHQPPPVQMIYPPLQPQNPNVMYSPHHQNLVFTTQTHNNAPPLYIPSYPHNHPPGTPTASQVQNFTSGAQQHAHDQHMMQLTQNMAQMSFPAGPPPVLQPPNKTMGFESPHPRMKGRTSTPKFGTGGPKGFFVGSSQSSTGTNSPAATVVSGYCPQQQSHQQQGMLYRTPPETPPGGFVPNFSHPGVSPVVFRHQMGGSVRANTPGTNRSSRSPTPANCVEVMSHLDRSRIVTAPALYHHNHQGLPYVIQQFPTDHRMVPGRCQPNAYRQPFPFKQQNVGQPLQDGGTRTFFATHKNQHRRTNKGNNTNKVVGISPNGKVL